MLKVPTKSPQNQLILWDRFSVFNYAMQNLTFILGIFFFQLQELLGVNRRVGITDLLYIIILLQFEHACRYESSEIISTTGLM